MIEPSTNGSNGRDQRGRFAKGNKHGTGNPHAKKVARLRSAMLKRVTAEDIREVADKLLSLAKAGDLAAIREVFDRTLGKPVALDLKPPDDIDGEIESLVIQLASRRQDEQA